MRATAPTRLAGLDYALLGLLGAGPASGYDLRKIFQDTPLGMYSDSPGSIYPALRRLEARGLVAGRRARGAVRRRRTLSLTRQGRTELRQWLSTPLTADQVTRDRGEADLRLAFLSDHAPPGVVRAFLRDYAEVLDERRRRVIAARAALTHRLSPSARLALELGLVTIAARAAWCRRVASRRLEP